MSTAATDWTEFNLNHRVRVQLTDHGRTIHQKFWEPYSGGKYRPPDEDGEGWTEFQLWDLMNVFGRHCGMAMPIPFSTTIQFSSNAA